MTQKENKKIVAFDTSGVLNILKNKVGEQIKIDDHFPKDRYLRFVYDEVIEEIFFDNDMNPIDPEERLDSYQKNEFHVLPPCDELLIAELQGRKRDIVENKAAEREIKQFLTGNHPIQQKKEEKFRKNRGDRLFTNGRDFEAIPYTESSEFCVTLSEVKKALDLFISATENKSKIIPISEHRTLEMKGKKLRVLDPKGCSKFKKFTSLEKEFPTVYAFLIVEEFKKILKRPKNSSVNPTKRFFILFEGMNVELKSTLFSDLRIAACCLPYVDEFATRDTGQAQLIKGLFPQYWDRVRYFSKKNGETYEDCTKEL